MAIINIFYKSSILPLLVCSGWAERNVLDEEGDVVAVGELPVIIYLVQISHVIYAEQHDRGCVGREKVGSSYSCTLCFKT